MSVLTPTRLSVLLLVLHCLLEIAVFIVAEADRACSLGGFHYGKRRIARRAGIGYGLIPEDKVAVGIIGTAVESLSPAGFSFDDFAGATFFPAADAGRFELDIFAGWVIAACGVFAKAAVFDGQLLAAHGAVLIQRNVLLDRRFPVPI